MTFLNPKEQVIDLQLTSYGRYLMSIGKLNPSYYAFFDDDIIYDRQYVSGSEIEPQNNIEPRIQEDTPRMAPQTIYRGAQVGAFHEDPQWAQNNLMPGVVADKTKKGFSLVEKPDSSYILSNPIGNSSFNSKNIAAWNVGFLKTPLLSASGSWIGSNNEIPTTFIPQLNCDLEYELEVYPPDNTLNGDMYDKMMTLMDSGIGEDPDETPLLFEEDNGFAVFKEDYALLKIEEENAEFTKDNFELEVYRIIKDSFVKADGTVVPEVKERLYFIDRDKPSPWEGTVAEYGDPNIPKADKNKYVGWYFEVLTDFEIDEEEYCRLRNQKEEVENIYLDQIFGCEEKKSQLESSNIYSTKENNNAEECD